MEPTLKKMLTGTLVVCIILATIGFLESTLWRVKIDLDKPAMRISTTDKSDSIVEGLVVKGEYDLIRKCFRGRIALGNEDTRDVTIWFSRLASTDKRLVGFVPSERATIDGYFGENIWINPKDNCKMIFYSPKGYYIVPECDDREQAIDEIKNYWGFDI